MGTRNFQVKRNHWHITKLCISEMKSKRWYPGKFFFKIQTLPDSFYFWQSRYSVCEKKDEHSSQTTATRVYCLAIHYRRRKVYMVWGFEFVDWFVGVFLWYTLEMTTFFIFFQVSHQMVRGFRYRMFCRRFLISRLHTPGCYKFFCQSFKGRWTFYDGFWECGLSAKLFSVLVYELFWHWNGRQYLVCLHEMLIFLF